MTLAVERNIKQQINIAGDFNTDFSRGKFFSNSLNMFMSQETMTCVSNYLNATADYTFVCKADGDNPILNILVHNTTMLLGMFKRTRFL